MHSCLPRCAMITGASQGLGRAFAEECAERGSRMLRARSAKPRYPTHEEATMTAVVTGATSGIGLEVARFLATAGFRIIGVGRDPTRCRSAEAELRSSTDNGRIGYLVEDLGSLAEVRSLAGRVRTMTKQIDVLVNNAGTFTVTRRETVDGIETQLAVNWLELQAQ